MQRMKSKESSHLSDYDSSDFSDYDGYYDNDDDIEDSSSSALHPLLEADMERVKNIYGSDALTYRLFSLVDSIDLELLVQTQFLDKDIALAWKIKPEEPLVVRLHLSVSHYLDGEVPKVEVFQPSQKERFGIGSQMRKILENFLSLEWRNINNDIVSSELKERSSSFSSSPLKRQRSKEITTPTGQAAPIDTASLAKIMEMGFSAEMGQNALVMSRGSLEEAVTLLLTNPDTCNSKVGSPQKTSRGGPLQRFLSKESKPHSSLPHPSDTSGGGSGGSSLWGWLTGNKSAALRSEKDAKVCPALDQGFLVMIMRYVYQRLPTLSEFCVVCDECHVFQNGGMLKPSVCARELCVFSFMSLGVMSDAADEIATGADVVDLLIAMANAACRSTRREDIFEPFPTVINPMKPKEMALSPKKKDFKRCQDAINSFMRMSEMMSLQGAELKKELDVRDNMAYPLLQWIVSSNRSHIVKLPPEKQLSCMRTPHQFLLMSSPPAKEAIFRSAKARDGSTYAFHGSPLENWHCIMRQGLMNASGTKYQKHGAAYGKGVYLSPLSSVSFGYSGIGNAVYGARTRPAQPAAKQTISKPYASQQSFDVRGGAKKMRRFLQSTNLTCVALCEVVTSRHLRKNNHIWVMPEADHVCTRFFFVYEDGQVGDTNINTTDPKYYQEIENAIRYHAS